MLIGWYFYEILQKYPITLNRPMKVLNLTESWWAEQIACRCGDFRNALINSLRLKLAPFKYC